MLTAQDYSLFVYNISILPVAFFSVLFFILALINIFVDNDKRVKYKKFKQLPFISVQVPTFNDPIALRCVKKCMEFDYPKKLFEIIIVDDSTNKKTQKILKKLSVENPGFIKYIHRDNRFGYKPGALKNAMKITKGEILVIFDSDWIPRKDFLRKIIEPFSDPKVAIVQTRQGFYNKDTNWITRFAAYTLMVYHTIIMPINNKINCVFFCGTAGALKRKAFEEVGGWNLGSITEDSELSVNLLAKGYKTVYLDFETPSEVPETFEGFVKQQMRWCYGNTRVFFDNARKILFNKNLTIAQRLMITFITLGNITAPFVVLMTISGFLGWFFGEPNLFQFQDVITLVSSFIITGGFLLIGAITLHKHDKLHEFPYLVLSALTVGIVLSIARSAAFVKAIFNSKLSWFCTPKRANTRVP